MSTAPIIDDNLPPTWEGQLSKLLGQYRNFATRDDAYSTLFRMASLAELYAARQSAQDGHTNAKELLRGALQAYLDRDTTAFTKLLAIANLADRQEAAQ